MHRGAFAFGLQSRQLFKSKPFLNQRNCLGKLFDKVNGGKLVGFKEHDRILVFNKHGKLLFFKERGKLR